MNRDKVIMVLAPLLAASLAANWWLWTRVPKSGEVSAPAAQTVSPEIRKSAPSERGAQEGYNIVPNLELKGRLGRLVVSFPADTRISGTRTGVNRSGDAKEIEAKYGNAQIELLPGTYDVTINGRVLTGVTVQSHQDTLIHVGVLRLNGSSSTRFGIFEPGGKDELQAKYGDADIGLPVGEYDVSIKDVRERVKIAAAAVTEF